MRRLVMASAAALLGVCVSACGGASSVVASGQEALPARSAQDWVTYGDAAVVVSVVAEHRGQRSLPEADAREGTIARTVDLAVDSVLWRRPGSREQVPAEMTWTTTGWTFSGDDERRMTMANQPDLVGGHQYVVAVVFRPVNPDGSQPASWIPLASEGIIPADDGKLGNGPGIVKKDPAVEGEEPPLRDMLWRRDVAAVTDVLSRTQPDLAAEPWMTADPVERYVQTMAAKSRPGLPAPSES